MPKKSPAHKDQNAPIKFNDEKYDHLHFSTTFEYNELCLARAAELLCPRLKQAATIGNFGALILLVLVALWAKDAIIVMIVLFVIATALSYVTSNWRKLQLRYARTTSLGSWTQVGRLHVAFCDDALHVEDKTGELATYPTSELRYVHETGDFVVAGFGRKRFVYVPRAALSENRWRELLRFLKDHR